MVLSSVAGIGNSAPATVKPEVKVTQTVSEKKIVKNPTEEYVRKYFRDIPIMIEVSRCESHFAQFDANGDILRGVVNNQDVGVMQINEHYHLDTAQDNNYNLYSVEGNTAYARKLYMQSGTDPWISSKPCWGKAQLGSNNLAMK